MRGVASVVSKIEEVQPADLVPADNLKGDSEEDTVLLKSMAQEARDFLTGFRWCNCVRNLYFGVGIGGVIGTFLARISPTEPDVDEWLWVVVGDIPPACLVTEAIPSPIDALNGYIAEMERWVNATRRGESIGELIPVNVPPTEENATALQSRLDFIRIEVIPVLREDRRSLM